jgi:hypothetical protein
VNASAPAPGTAPAFAFTHSLTSMGSLASTISSGLDNIPHGSLESLPSITPITSSSAVGSLAESSPRIASVHGDPILDPQRVSPSATPHSFLLQGSYLHGPGIIIDDAEHPELDYDSDEDSEPEFEDSMLEEAAYQALHYHHQDHSSPPSPSARARYAAAFSASSLAAATSVRAQDVIYARAQLDLRRRQLEHPPSLRAQSAAAATPGAIPGAPPGFIRPPPMPVQHMQPPRPPMSQSAAADRPALRSGDVVYWHHLTRGGEITGVREDNQARQPRRAMIFDR